MLGWGHDHRIHRRIENRRRRPCACPDERDYPADKGPPKEKVDQEDCQRVGVMAGFRDQGRQKEKSERKRETNQRPEGGKCA